MISLAGGLPNPELFPFKGMKVELRLFLNIFQDIKIVVNNSLFVLLKP